MNKTQKGSVENTSTRESGVVIHAQGVLEGNIPKHDTSRVERMHFENIKEKEYIRN